MEGENDPAFRRGEDLQSELQALCVVAVAGHGIDPEIEVLQVKPVVNSLYKSFRLVHGAAHLFGGKISGIAPFIKMRDPAVEGGRNKPYWLDGGLHLVRYGNRLFQVIRRLRIEEAMHLGEVGTKKPV